jgi:hypothetical protein
VAGNRDFFRARVPVLLGDDPLSFVDLFARIARGPKDDPKRQNPRSQPFSKRSVAGERLREDHDGGALDRVGIGAELWVSGGLELSR